MLENVRKRLKGTFMKTESKGSFTAPLPGQDIFDDVIKALKITARTDIIEEVKTAVKKRSRHKNQ